MGARNTATVLRKAMPLNKAYNEANTFAVLVVSSVTGPIPVNIIDAL